MFWAMRNLPEKEATKHLLVMGTIGSGKTSAIKLFLQSIAPRFLRDWKRPEQLIIFDAKCEVISQLAALGLRPEHDNVYILNPDDERGAVWDLGDAVRTPALARHFASLLVPEEPRSSAPYFSEGARLLVYAVILALNRLAGSHWTFRDLLCAMDSREHIAAISALHPPSQRVVDRFLKDEKHFDGILSSLATKLGPFDQVAALWHSSRNGRRFTIPEFLSKPGVLILSNDPLLKDSFWPINAILLKALTHEILRGPETNQPRHWFVLDEFPAMNKVDSIQELLTRGRSKGVSVLLGTQGIENLSEVYGDNGAELIMSQCAYKTFLRAGGPKTARWAKEFFGNVRRTETIFSESWGKGGYSSSLQYSVQERSVFTDAFFTDLPFPEVGGPYVAVSDVPCLQSTLISRRPFDQVLSWFRPPVSIKNTLPRPNIEDQTLWPWSKEEESAFCKPSSSKDQPEKPTKKANTDVKKPKLPSKKNQEKATENPSEAAPKVKLPTRQDRKR